jgi:hypothetical protein
LSELNINKIFRIPAIMVVAIVMGRRGRQLPAKLWGFVDLTMIPQNNGIRIAGLDAPPRCMPLSRAPRTDGPGRHRYVRYICSTKEVGNIAGAVPGAFGTYGGCSDIGGDPNAYFYVKIGYVEKILGVARNTRP